jgi:hypothetical protein
VRKNLRVQLKIWIFKKRKKKNKFKCVILTYKNLVTTKLRVYSIYHPNCISKNDFSYGKQEYGKRKNMQTETLQMNTRKAQKMFLVSNLSNSHHVVLCFIGQSKNTTCQKTRDP